MASEGRQLSELLKEQQEPFLNSQSSDLCWPGGNACRRLQKLRSIGIKKRGRFLKCVLTKLVYCKSIRKALKWKSKTNESQRGRLGVFYCFQERENDTSKEESDCLFDYGMSAREFNGEHQWRCSPLSVLGLHSGEGSPLHNTSNLDPQTWMETSIIFQELLESAFPLPPPKHVKTKRKLRQLDKLVLDCLREVKERILDSHGCLGPEMTEQDIQEQILSWGRQRGDATSITKLMESDLANSMEWSHFQPQMRETGTEIEAAIFEEIREETVLDMLDLHFMLEM